VSYAESVVAKNFNIIALQQGTRTEGGRGKRRLNLIINPIRRSSGKFFFDTKDRFQLVG